MKVACDACGVECEVEVKVPTLLRRALPKGWRPRLIDGKTYVLCDVCGNLRQFVGGLSPYLATRLNLPPNVAIEFPEYTDLPDSWLAGRRFDKEKRSQEYQPPKDRKTRAPKGGAMTDINKIIASGNSGGDPEREERAAEIGAWSKDDAADSARQENIELTDNHIAVIRCLQEDYIEHGSTRHARDLVAMLDERFASKGGRKYLYELFPGGPISQGGRLAGIPVPADAKDNSFGSVL